MSAGVKNKQRLSLSTKVLIGLILGIATGLFFGELVEPLDVVGEAFIQLLQMTVLPYLTVSLVAGLASLTYGEALSLAKKGGLLLLFLWLTALGVVLLMPFAIPKWDSASFFSTLMTVSGLPIANAPDAMWSSAVLLTRSSWTADTANW